MKIKALLCCMNRKPWLVRNESDKYWYTMKQFQLDTFKNVRTFNGLIIAECDFEVEEIDCKKADKIDRFYKYSRLTYRMLDEYLKGNNGYAIHIKNLHIFDYPEETGRYSTRTRKVVSDIICDSCTAFGFDCRKCPDGYDYQNVGYIRRMMKVYGRTAGSEYIAIPVTPEEMCRIANKEQIVLVRRTVLKEMK